MAEAETTTLTKQISALAQQVGEDVKSLVGKIGDLGSLTTTQKANLVAALNELKSGLTSVESKLGAQINDGTIAADKTWSSQKINNQISTAVAGLVNGAPETLDTLKELADALEENKDAIEALEALAAGHVKYDAAQSLNDGQKKQARDNIGAASAAELGTVGSLATSAKGNVVAAVNEVKSTADAAKSAASKAQSTADAAKSAAATAQSTADGAQTTADGAKTTADSALSKATGNEAKINTLTTNVGDTTTDFVKIYTAARDGTVEE